MEKMENSVRIKWEPAMLQSDGDHIGLQVLFQDRGQIHLADVVFQMDGYVATLCPGNQIKTLKYNWAGEVAFL